MGVTADYVIEADISEFKGVTRETNPNETQRETRRRRLGGQKSSAGEGGKSTKELSASELWSDL